MAPVGDADYYREKARRDLLALLEGVSITVRMHLRASTNGVQARGKKNLVISQELAGPVGLFVKFSVLQEYGVDRVFLIENANIDSSQRNIVFLVRGEKAHHVRTVAGRTPISLLVVVVVDNATACVVYHSDDGTSVDCTDEFPTLRNQS